LHFVSFAAYSVQDIAVFGAGASSAVFRDIRKTFGLSNVRTIKQSPTADSRN